MPYPNALDRINTKLSSRPVTPELTLAELQALGTDDGLAVGDRCMVSDRTEAGLAECLSATASSSVWGYKRPGTLSLNFSSTSTATGEKFGSWSTYTISNSAGPNPSMGRVMANPTEIKRMVVKIQNDPGATTMRVYAEQVLLEAVGGTPAADTALTYVFTAAASLDAGDWLEVSLDQANARTANEAVGVTIEIVETVTLS